MSVAGAEGAVARSVSGRLVAALPQPVSDRARLLLSRWIDARLRHSSAHRGAALVFHAVDSQAGNPAFEIEPAIATGQLDAIVGHLKRRYRLVRAGELIDAVRDRRAGEPVPVAVTFDDDLRSHVEHAAPVFERRGCPATAFLTGTLSPFWWQLLQMAIDSRAISPGGLAPVPADQVAEALERHPGAISRLAWTIENLTPPVRDRVADKLRDAVPEPPPAVGALGLAALEAAGWEIGFHTVRHDLLTALDDAALAEALERRPLGNDASLPQTLAYPHGKATEREAAAAQRAGYAAAFTGRSLVVTERTNAYLVGRLQPETSTLGRFALELARALNPA